MAAVQFARRPQTQVRRVPTGGFVPQCARGGVGPDTFCRHPKTATNVAQHIWAAKAQYDGDRCRLL